MPMSAIARLSTLLVAACLAAYFWWQGEQFLAANGPTFDECVHVAAGYSYWRTGDFRMNREDPPLLKLWWALPLALDGRPPYPTDAAESTNHNHWQVGIAFLYHSGVPHQQLLKPARRMNLLIGCGIVLVAAWWAFRAWRSRLAGLAAAAFAAFDPNLLALSCVLSTDAGFAFFALLSCYLLWEYTAAPSRPLLILSGVSLGLMLGSKFSAIAMIAGIGAAGIVHMLGGGALVLPGVRRDANAAGRVRQAFDLAFRLGLIAAAALAATYGFVHFDEWGRGLKFQLTRSEHGDGRMYLLGELSTSGWYQYFLIALAVKLPLGFVAAAIGALPSLACRAGWLVIPPLVFFTAASLARVDLGIRVVLPAIVFFYVVAGGLAEPGRFRAVRRTLLLLCLAWVGHASWHAAPHQICYFNEIARGQGTRFVADSNVDWGQGLPELRNYMERERLPIVYLSFFGTDRPEAYGIRFQALPGYGRVGPAGGESIPSDASRHVLAISANNLLGIYLKDAETFAFLRNRTPTAVLGGCLYVFDVTTDPESLRLLRRIPTP
jgi:hypothetical protein